MKGIRMDVLKKITRQDIDHQIEDVYRELDRWIEEKIEDCPHECQKTFLRILQKDYLGLAHENAFDLHCHIEDAE